MRVISQTTEPAGGAEETGDGFVLLFEGEVERCATRKIFDVHIVDGMREQPFHERYVSALAGDEEGLIAVTSARREVR